MTAHKVLTTDIYLLYAFQSC